MPYIPTNPDMPYNAFMWLLHQHQQFSSKTSCFCYINTNSLVGKPHVSSTPAPVFHSHAACLIFFKTHHILVEPGIVVEYTNGCVYNQPHHSAVAYINCLSAPR